MNALECKIKLLHYFRFKRRFKYIATEAGKFNSDVLISNESQILEIEVKVSFADLKNEFKKRKHEIYKSPSYYYKQYLPNFFYFAVPRTLVRQSLLFLKDSPYGLISISTKSLSNKKDETYCKILKRAKPIHDKFNERLHDQIILRMGSELIRSKLKGFIND